MFALHYFSFCFRYCSHSCFCSLSVSWCHGCNNCSFCCNVWSVLPTSNHFNYEPDYLYLWNMDLHLWQVVSELRGRCIQWLISSNVYDYEATDSVPVICFANYCLCWLPCVQTVPVISFANYCLCFKTALCANCLW